MRLLRFQRKMDDEKGAGLLGLSLQVGKRTGCGSTGIRQRFPDNESILTSKNKRENDIQNKWFSAMSYSVQATMEALMSLGLHKQAEQLYKDFRVPDKR